MGLVSGFRGILRSPRQLHAPMTHHIVPIDFQYNDMYSRHCLSNFESSALRHNPLLPCERWVPRTATESPDASYDLSAGLTPADRQNGSLDARARTSDSVTLGWSRNLLRHLERSLQTRPAANPADQRNPPCQQPTRDDACFTNREILALSAVVDNMSVVSSDKSSTVRPRRNKVRDQLRRLGCAGICGDKVRCSRRLEE